MLMFVTRSGM